MRLNSERITRMYCARFGISTPNIFSTAIAYATPFIIADM